MIKVVPVEDKIESVMALKEGQSLMEIEHPNVCTHYEQYVNENQELCTVIEYAPSMYNSKISLIIVL